MERKIALGIIIILLLAASAACSSNQASADARRTEIAGTLFAQQTAAGAQTQPVPDTPTTTTTKSPTHTPSPSPTPSPTATPTASPVPAGFTVLNPQEPIQAGNLSRLAALAQWGSGAINQIVVSPEGDFLAIASSQGVDIYDQGGFNLLYHWASGSTVSGVALSSRKQLVAYAAGDQIRVASLETGSQITELESWNETGIVRLRFSPDGAFLAVWEGSHPSAISYETNFCVFDTASWTESNCFRVDDERVEDVQISPQSHFVIASQGFGGGVYVWDLTSGELINKISEWVLEDLENLISPDDSWFVNHSGPDINLVDLANGLPILTLEESPLFEYDRSFSPDGNYLVLAGEDWRGDGGLILLWDLVKDTVTPYSLPDWGTSVAFSEDGRLVASTTRDGLAQVWEFDGSSLKPKGKFIHAGIESATFGKDGDTLITTSSNQIVKIWDLKSNALQKTIGEKIFTGAFTNVAIAPNMEYIAASSTSGMVAVWRAENGELLFTFQHRETESEYQGIQIGFTHDASFIITLDEESIRQWSLEDGEKKYEFRLTTDKENYRGPNFIYHNEGYYFIGPEYSASLMDTQDELIIVLNEWTRTLIRPCIPEPAWNIEINTSLKRASDFSKINQLSCVANEAGNILPSPLGSSVYSLSMGEEQACADSSYNVINNVCWINEETPVASGEEVTSIKDWNSAEGSLQHEYQFPGYALSWAISPDGKYLGLMTIDGIELLDLQSWEVIQRLMPPGALSPSQRGEMISASPPLFSPDSSLLFTSQGDEIHIWQVNTGQIIGTLSGHVGEVTGVDISPDGTLLVSAARDGTIRLWGVR